MNVIVANVALNPEHAPLVNQFLSLRRSVFVDKLSWPLDVWDGLEFEQYDIVPLTYYIMVVEGDRVLGGGRLLRCDASNGTGTAKYSYMIRDAWCGLIDLPRGLSVNEPTTSPKFWEFTRFLVAEDKPGIAAEILSAMQAFLERQGAHGCLFLGSPAFMRTARRHGFHPKALGPVQHNNDGRFVAFMCDFGPEHPDMVQKVTS